MHSANYIILYMSFVLMCISLIIMMAVKMNTNIAATAEVVMFRRLAVISIIEMISQCFWIINTSESFMFLVWVQYVYNLADLIFTGLICYIWYLFVDMKVSSREKLLHRNRFEKIFQRLPITILITAAFLSLFNHKVFYIAKGGIYTRGPWYFIQIIGCYFYYVAVVITLLYNQRRHALSRNTFWVYITFTLIPTFGGIFQTTISYDIPFTAMFFTAGMLLMFSELQNQQINTDALTGLNNRARASVYISSRLSHAEKEPFCLFMADIDNFKQINDRHGHIMGDQSLILVSKTFQKLGKEYKSLFASRYGGDEFLCVVSPDEVDPEEFAMAFAQLLEKALEESGLAFRFTVSLGFTIADQEDLTEKQLVNKADAHLYTNKSVVHGLRQAAR